MILLRTAASEVWRHDLLILKDLPSLWEWSLITEKGGGGYKMGRGASSEDLALQKKRWGRENRERLSHAEGGAKKVLR